MLQHFYCDVTSVFLVSHSAFLSFVQCCDSAFGVATLHFSYMYNVATLSVNVETDVAVGVSTLHFAFLDHVVTLGVDVPTLL